MFSLLAGSVEGRRKKLSARAASIFSSSSGSGLFADAEEEEEEEGGKEGAKPLESSSSGGLFGEDDDDVWMTASSKGKKGVLLHICVSVVFKLVSSPDPISRSHDLHAQCTSMNFDAVMPDSE